MELALGIVGTLLGVLSLAWQAHTWRLSGARVSVDGILYEEEGSNPVLKVEVRNEGRGDCELRSVDLIHVSGRDGIDPTKYRLGDAPTLPCRLGAGQCAVLEYRASAIARALAHHGARAWEARIQARLGDGSEVLSEGTLAFSDTIATEDEFQVDHGKGIVATQVYGSTVGGRGRRHGARLLRLLRL